LQILGRVDDVIVTGGLKVAPSALEAAIAVLPAVAEVVVVGVPDSAWGERVAAVVVPVATAQPPLLQELRKACDAAGIDKALQPRSVTLVDRLPVRGPGKPDRIAAAGLAATAAIGPSLLR
jgi:O-succinylbenzoic acid--CoA ligase